MFDRVLDAVEPERRERVEARREGAQREQVDGEREQPGRERRERVGHLRRVRCGERTPLEERDDEGARQPEVQGGRRHDHHDREAESPRELRTERVEIAAHAGGRELGRERGHERHREQAVRELEERVGADVHERAAGGAVGEDGHDEQRDLVGDDVPDRPSRQPHHRAHGRVPETGQEPQAHPGPVQRRQQRERHHHDAGGRPEADQRDEGGVVEDVWRR